MISRESLASELEAEGFARHADMVRDGAHPSDVLDALESERMRYGAERDYRYALAALCEASAEVS